MPYISTIYCILHLVALSLSIEVELLSTQYLSRARLHLPDYQESSHVSHHITSSLSKFVWRGIAYTSPDHFLANHEL